MSSSEQVEGHGFSRAAKAPYLYFPARTLVRAGLVGVGIMIAHNPLHRSGQAELPHPALALGNDAQTA